MAERKKQRVRAPKSNDTVPLTSYPGRILVLVMLVVAPWLLGSLAGWAQFGLGVISLVALGLWFLEIAINRPKALILPLSVLPILLAIGLGILQIWPLSSEIKERLAATHSQQQWEQLAAATELDREVVSQLELHLEQSTAPYAWPERLPISIDPHATRLMTTQLLFAAIGYVLGAYYFHQSRSLFWLCLVMTVNGLVLAAFGIVQKLTGADNSLFMGALQVDGTVFGPYVNRNNAAGWLIMSMAAAVMLVMTAFLGNSELEEDRDDWMIHEQRKQSDWWYSLLRLVHELNARKLAAVFALVFIVGGVMTTLSRGGTLGMILGSVIGFIVIGVSSSSRGRQGIQYLAVAIVLGLLLVGWLGFGQKLMDRFDQADKANILDDARVQNWTDTWSLFSEQWLVGSGLNTYQHVHRPMRTTVEQNIYAFAENQYFQTLIDAGLVGGLLLVIMMAWSVYQVTYLVRRARHPAMLTAGVLGSVAIGSQAVSAFFDFGLYLPANSLTFAVLMGAIAGQAQNYARRDSESPGVMSTGWGRLAPVLVLLMLGAGIVGALQHYRLGQTEDALLLAKTIREKDRTATIEEVDQAVQKLSVLARMGLEANLHDALGQLWLQKYRRSELDRLMANFSSDPNDKQLQELWASTSPTWRATLVRQMRAVNPAAVPALQTEFTGGTEQRALLLAAYGEFLLSRQSNPFRPELHLRLADLGRFLAVQTPVPHLERAVLIGPQNPQYRWVAGIQTLEACQFNDQAEIFELGMDHLRKAIELDPNGTRAIEPLVLKKMVLGVPADGLPAEVYAKRLLAGHPDLLLDFVNRNLELRNQPEVRKQLLLATKAQLDARRLEFNYSVPETWAMGRIEMELGNWEAAREQFDMLLQLSYGHTAGRYQRVLVRIELGELAKAEDEMRGLVEANPNNTTYQQTLKRIQAARLQAP
jgi:O-antigen ligase/tetratricopeptide (TPR) repeat protein